MVPTLASSSPHSLEGGLFELGSVAILLGHLKTTSAVNLVRLHVALEEANLMIAGLPSIVIVQAWDYARIDMRRLRLETDHQAGA